MRQLSPPEIMRTTAIRALTLWVRRAGTAVGSVFTELARSYRSSDDIHYGLINLRTDGDQIVLAQMLEKRSGTDLWDAYMLP